MTEHEHKPKGTRLTESEFVCELGSIIEDEYDSQADAARQWGLTKQQVNSNVRGKVSPFSPIADKAGYDIETRLVKTFVKR